MLYALVIGRRAVSLAAIYESRTHYDVFDHLHKWIPFLEPTRIDRGRRGAATRLRVRASAQHPIALGAALTMTVPLAVVPRRPRARRGVRALLLGRRRGVLCVVGALDDGLAHGRADGDRDDRSSRSLVRRQRDRALLAAAAIVLLAVVHFAAPGTLGSLYHAFVPQGGLVQSQTRASAATSARAASPTSRPGLRSWKQAPVFGHGLGTGKRRRGSNEPGAIVDPKTGAPIIFDDQYLNTLVSIGFVGLIGVLWFVWGGVAWLVTTARRARRGRASDLVAACADLVRRLRRGHVHVRRVRVRAVHAGLLRDRGARAPGADAASNEPTGARSDAHRARARRADDGKGRGRERRRRAADDGALVRAQPR